MRLPTKRRRDNMQKICTTSIALLLSALLSSCTNTPPRTVYIPVPCPAPKAKPVPAEPIPQKGEVSQWIEDAISGPPSKKGRSALSGSWRTIGRRIRSGRRGSRPNDLARRLQRVRASLLDRFEGSRPGEYRGDGENGPRSPLARL